VQVVVMLMLVLLLLLLLMLLRLPLTPSHRPCPMILLLLLLPSLLLPPSQHRDQAQREGRQLWGRRRQGARPWARSAGRACGCRGGGRPPVSALHWFGLCVWMGEGREGGCGYGLEWFVCVWTGACMNGCLSWTGGNG
jgi:hypothetical protein